MSRYRIIHCLIWNDDRFPYASDHCQLVFFHLLTTPFSSPFGLYKASLEALAAEKRWDVKTYRAGLNEASVHGFVEYDEHAHVIFIPNFIKYNPPANPNVLKHWLGQFEEIPNSPLKQKFYQALEAFTEAYGKGLGQAFQDVWTKGSPKQDEEQGITSHVKVVDTMPQTTALVPVLTPEELMALYNETIPVGHPRVKVLSKARQEKVRKMLKQFPSLDFWRSIFLEIPVSPLLQGLRPSKDHPNFIATFDWFVSKGQDGIENCVKVSEGKYREREEDKAREYLGVNGTRMLSTAQRLLEQHGFTVPQEGIPHVS